MYLLDFPDSETLLLASPGDIYLLTIRENSHPKAAFGTAWQVAAACCLLLPTQAACAADEPAMVCSGWNSNSHSWGFVGHDDPLKQCAPGSAMITVQYGGGPRNAGPQIPVRGTCCPLPEGALTDEVVFVDEACPPDFLVTGVRTEREHEHQLQCSKINTQQFALGSQSVGLLAGWHMHFRSYFKETFSYESIPLALRLGAGRFEKYGWNRVFCLGYPWGSVLTAKHSKYCEGHTFRQLMFRKPDQAPSTPALAYEKCLAVDDRYAEQPRCALVHREGMD